MLQFSVKHDFDKVLRRVEDHFKRQVPYAAARALTATAKDVQRAEAAEIDRVFDRPVDFTRRAVGAAWATKESLRSRVFLKDIQARYLGLQIGGGTRRPAKRALLVPGKALELDPHGNIRRKEIKRLLARPDVFSGTVRGIAGLWQRQKKGPPKLLVLWEPKAEYRKRFPFVEVAQREIERTLLPNLRRALREAIASSR